jgi:MFS family permease
MVPKEQYTRASGIMSIAQTSSNILAPAIAAVLLTQIGLEGILLIDILTFLLAIGALLFVFIPQPQATEEGQTGRGNLLREAAYGFQYILERPSLLYLQLVFFFGNFLSSFANPLYVPMIMARSGSNTLALGAVQTTLGFGGLAGGLVLSVWGGPKRRIHGVLLGWFLSGLSNALVGLGQGVVVWAVGAFLILFINPFINGSNQAIWQSKVAPDVQGRVFSVRLLIAQVSVPVAMALSGPLADQVFEPAMTGGSALSAAAEPLFGTSVGSGMALMIFASGLLTALAGLAGYLVPKIRKVEDILPDHQAIAAAAQVEPSATPAVLPAAGE